MPGILLAIGYTAMLLLLMRHMRFFATVPGLPVRWLGWILLLKIAAGTALWAVYTWVYTDRATADVFKYFDDSAVMFSALYDHPMDYVRMLLGMDNDTPELTSRYYMVMNNWFREYESDLYNDSHTIIRFNAFIRLFSFGVFHVHTVIIAFLSLTGMVGLYRAFVGYLPGREGALVGVVFLMPSVLFWASGVVKESLLFFGLGLLVFQVVRWITDRATIAGSAMLVASGIVLFFLKFYVLLSLAPALILFAWSRRKTPALGLKVVVVYALCLAMALSLPLFFPQFDVLRIIALKHQDFIGLAESTNPGSFVMPPSLEPELWSFIQQAPYALYITLLGPLVHAASGALGLVAALENLAIMVIFTFCFAYCRSWRMVDKGLILSLLLYVTLLALVIGWTTPVMGAIVRYRTPLFPFLLIAALLVVDQNRIIARWPRLKPFISA